MNDIDDEPVEMNEPKERFEAPENVWMRGLWMLVFVILFALAETILGVIALVQFLWMVFAKEKNALLVSFGHDLGKWMRQVADFQSGHSDDKPFPWQPWGQ
jgi:hypothetical protein